MYMRQHLDCQFDVFVHRATTQMNKMFCGFQKSQLVTFWHLSITCIIVSLLAIAIQPGGNVASAEYFSSVDSLHKLLDVEQELVEAFRNYLDLQGKELTGYERFIGNIKTQHSFADEDLEDFLGNPINAFTLIKRMVIDWNNLKELIKNSQAISYFREALEDLKQNQQLPDDNELKGAVKGLVRLQKVYNLSTQDLANGLINDIFSDTALSWRDCFEIATSLFDEKEISFALTWFEVTLKKLNAIESNEKDKTHRRFKIETLEYLALANNELGNSEKAIDYIDEILELEPNHHTRNIRIYLLNIPRKQPPAPNRNNHSTFYQNYTRLCRGIQIPEEKLLKLQCTVETRENPYFMLAPLKIEELSKDPEILVYHGLLTDEQIDEIIEQTEDRMFRSQTVLNESASVVTDIRVSQQTWLWYKTPVMKSVKHLVAQITSLDLANAEAMQIANYGIGGQYEPHLDFLGPNYKQTVCEGDRISTNVIYLSDVEQGGFTVFPLINTFSRPIKGSMASWYNLHRSLDGDYRTLHAGCPVVTGSKRIGNVWIHSGHQEFRRPCDLINDKFKSKAYE